MTTVLITGADGFIAPHIIRHLHGRARNRVVAVGRRPGQASPAPGIDRAVADLTDAAQTLELVRRWRPDAVVHAAGQRSAADDAEWRIEREMAHAIMEAVARAAPAAHLILLGSAAEYGLRSSQEPIAETADCRPTTAYGRAKLAVTEDALARTRRGQLNVTVLRPFNAIGPGIRPTLAAGAFLAQIHQSRRRGGPYVVRMGPRHHVRDFFAVDDMAGVIARALELGATGDVINVCSGQGRTLDGLLRRMAGLAGASVEFEGDGAPEDPPTISVGDPGKCLRLLGLAPSPDLDATLLAMWEEAVADRDGIET